MSLEESTIRQAETSASAGSTSGTGLYDSEDNYLKESDAKENKKRPVAVILFIAILALGAIVAFLFLRNNDETVEEVSTPRTVVVTQDNVEEVMEEMSQDEFIEPGYFEVSMTNTWYFADGESPSRDAYIGNVIGNTNDVYFDLVLEADESQVIYASPIIPRGSYIDEFTLDTPLDEGAYDCVMIYHLVDDDQNTVSTLRVGVTVIVEG